MLRARFKSILSSAFTNWLDHQDLTQSAAIAYYTLFSIAPVLIIAIAVSGWLFGQQASRGAVFRSVHGMIGTDGAQAIQAMVHAAAHQPHAGIIATILGIITLIVGASGVFVQLQQSLNSIWGVKTEPGRSLSVMVRQRLLSFAMILVFAFLLMVSLVVSTVLTAVGSFLTSSLPGGLVLWKIVNELVSLGVITVLFGAIFRILPDVELRWKDVWGGALLTAFLFTLGKALIGLYLGKSSMGSAYGAAGSLVVLLVWVSYSSAIVLFGVEFTRAYVLELGHPVKPKNGAVLGIQNNPPPLSEEGQRTGIAA